MNSATDATGLIPLLTLDTESNNNLREVEGNDDDKVYVLREDVSETMDTSSILSSLDLGEEEDNLPEDITDIVDNCNTLDDIRRMIDAIGGLDSEKQALSMPHLRACLNSVASNIAEDVKGYFSLFQNKGIFSTGEEKRFFSLEDQKSNDFALRLHGPLTMPGNYTDIPLVPKLETAMYEARGVGLVDMLPYEIWDIIFSITGYKELPEMLTRLRRTCRLFNAICLGHNTQRRIVRTENMPLRQVQEYEKLETETDFLREAGTWATQLIDSMPDTIQTLNINLNTISMFMIGAGVDRFKPRKVVSPFHMRDCVTIIFEKMMCALEEKESVKKLVLWRVTDSSKGMPKFSTAFLDNVFSILAAHVDRTGIHILDVSRLNVESCPTSLLKSLSKMKNIDTLICDNICLDGSTFRGIVNIQYLIANSVYFSPITHLIGKTGNGPEKWSTKQGKMGHYSTIFRRKNLNIVCNVFKGTGCTSCTYRFSTLPSRHNRIYADVKNSLMPQVNSCCIDKLFFNMKWGVENLLVTERAVDPSIGQDYLKRAYGEQNNCHSTIMVTAGPDSVMQLFTRPSRNQVKKYLDYDIVKVPEEYTLVKRGKMKRTKRIRKKLRMLEKKKGSEDDALIKFMEQEIESLKKKRASSSSSSVGVSYAEFIGSQKGEKRKRSSESSSIDGSSSEDEEDEPKMIEKRVYKDPNGKLSLALRRDPLDMFDSATKEEWYNHFNDIISEGTRLNLKDFEDHLKEDKVEEGPTRLFNPFLILRWNS